MLGRCGGTSAACAYLGGLVRCVCSCFRCVAMQERGVEVSDKEIQMILAEVDKDNDNLIDYNEFCEMMHKSGLGLMQDSREAAFQDAQHTIGFHSMFSCLCAAVMPDVSCRKLVAHRVGVSWMQANPARSKWQTSQARRVGVSTHTRRPRYCFDRGRHPPDAGSTQIRCLKRGSRICFRFLREMKGRCDHLDVGGSSPWARSTIALRWVPGHPTTPLINTSLSLIQALHLDLWAL